MFIKHQKVTVNNFKQKKIPKTWKDALITLKSQKVHRKPKRQANVWNNFERINMQWSEIDTFMALDNWPMSDPLDSLWLIINYCWLLIDLHFVNSFEIKE